MSRNLNIELVRIVSMALIVLGHIWGGYIPLVDNASEAFRHHVSQLTFFVPFHVNLFVLISGYCGIKRLNGVIKVWKLVFSYLALVALLNLVFHWGSFDYSTLVFSLSHNPWWFMRIYFLLVLVAPVALEPLLNRIEKKERTALLWVFLIIDVYLGYYCRMSTVHFDGYNLIHFVTIYIIGSSLRNFSLRDIYFRGIRLHAWHFFALFAAVMLLKLMVHYVLVLLSVKDYFMDYNNPFNILLAIAAFVGFLNLNIRSPKVLFVSTSVIGVYLLPEHPLVSDWLKGLFCDLIGQCHAALPLEMGVMLLFFLAVFIVSIMIDKIRAYIVGLIQQPISRAINRISYSSHANN